MNSPTNKSQFLVLHFMMGYSYDEIARGMGVDALTLKEWARQATAPDTTPEWKEKIAVAQKIKTYVVNGVAHKRIPYGKENQRWTGRCHDCGVKRGDLHVPGCDVEQCPACDGQIISCSCQMGEQ